MTRIDDGSPDMARTAENMIRRVGLAIDLAWNDGGPGGQDLPPIELTPAELHHLARAAIQAMREPTKEMVDAYDTADLPFVYHGWRNAIDAALSPPLPSTEQENG